MCGWTTFPLFCPKLIVKFVCAPFTIGVGVGCTITLRLHPLVALFIVAADVIAYVDDGINKIPKMRNSPDGLLYYKSLCSIGCFVLII